MAENFQDSLQRLQKRRPPSLQGDGPDNQRRHKKEVWQDGRESPECEVSLQKVSQITAKRSRQENC
jgi:hypothetical protein